MSFEIAATSNPYFSSASVEKGSVTVIMAVDQLYVNKETNEQRIFTEYFTQEFEDATPRTV